MWKLRRLRALHRARETRRRNRTGRARTSYALPILASIASLGFEGAEAGILRNAPTTNGLSRATASELALRGTGLRRSARVEQFAARYRIAWDLSARIYDAAVAAGIEPELAYRLVRVESSFRRRVIGPVGSIGYTQVQPNTAQWLDPTVTRDDLFETETNLQLGFRYLRMLIDRYGDTRIALLAYNRGPGTVEAVMANGEDPANGYAVRVLGNTMR